MKIIRPLIALLILLPLSYSFVLQFVDMTAFFNLQEPQIWFWSFLAGIFLLSLIFIKQSSFIAILKHELCHNLFAILTFHKPVALHVTAGKGGEFHHEGKTNFLMILAPYFFPLLSSIMMLVSLLDIRAHSLFIGLLGAAIGFDSSSALKDTHLKQKDLREYGLFFSLCFIVLIVLILYGMLIAYATRGYSAAGSYFIDGFVNCYKRIMALFAFIAQVIAFDSKVSVFSY